MLDKRLGVCMSLVSDGGIACDVGTDHAYLAAELLLAGRCTKVIASDIADGPLDAARQTIEKKGLSDRAEVVKSDGLKNITPDGITDVIMAGMGGELIARIISEAPWLKENRVRLILQPMTKEKELRRELYRSGFSISEEKAVRDGKRAYTVMLALYTGEVREGISVREEYFGALVFDNDDAAAYGEKVLTRLGKELDGCRSEGKPETAQLEEIKAELVKIIGGNEK
ncbi:MAG: SAM-dependent methyltransferase [Ruminococcus sp.]|nr:SAM-dependent methyltransferase [Ruminococcus sp.]